MTDSRFNTRISRNALANLLTIGFVAVVSFVLSPFIVHRLGTEGFGVWSLVAGLLGYLGLLDLGIRQAVNRYVARHHAAGEHGEGSGFTSTALTVFVTAAGAAMLLSVLLAVAMPYLFNVPDELLPDARTIVLIGGVSVALSLVIGLYGGIVTGVQRFDVQAVVEITVTALRALGIVLALVNDYGLVGLSVVHLASAAIRLMCYRIAAGRLYPELRPRLTSLATPRTRELLAFSSSSFAIFLLDTIAFRADILVLAVMLPVESIAFYAIAANLITQAHTLPASFTYLLTPRVSALASKGSGEIGRQILVIGKYASLIVLPVALSFIIRGDTFLTLWMGPEIAEQSAIVLATMALILWVGAGRSAVIHGLTGLGVQRIVVPTFAMEAVANVVLSVALVPVFGILGVVIGTLVTCMVVSLVILPRFLHRAAGVSLRDYYDVTVLRPVLASVPFAIASLAMERSWPPGGLVLFFAQVLLILPLIPAAAWLLCFSDQERRSAASSFASWLARTRA